MASQYVMDRFYRRMRQQTGILMQGKKSAAKPVPAASSHSTPKTATPGRASPPSPRPPVYPPDAITQEVIALVDHRSIAHHFGTTAGFDLPCTQPDSDAFWRFALGHLLPTFGPL